MTKLIPLNKEFKFNRIIGTGGLGTGMFFKLQGNHTLGRNESRPGERLPYKDYCKQHIILHYLAVLLSGESFDVCPIGKVGDDEQGLQILKEMTHAGMKMHGVKKVPGTSTLFSVCFIYPDSTGGNITTSTSASSRVDSDDIREFIASVTDLKGSTIMLAAPEVPVEARIELLKEGRKRQCFNAASVLSAEVGEFGRLSGFQLTDLLAVNIDEASAIIQRDDEIPSEDIARAAYNKLFAENSDIMLIVTDGPRGSYCFKDGNMEFIPALKTKAATTGGAGDALLSGTLIGLCCGLPFFKGNNDSIFSETPIKSAVELGTLLASLSVTTYDSIHQCVSSQLLKEYADSKGVVFSKEFMNIFKNKQED